MNKLSLSLLCGALVGFSISGVANTQHVDLEVN